MRMTLLPASRVLAHIIWRHIEEKQNLFIFSCLFMLETEPGHARQACTIWASTLLQSCFPGLKARTF